MISPYNDDYDPREVMFERYAEGVYAALDSHLGLSGNARTKQLIYLCLFDSWREEQKEAIKLFESFTAAQVYLLSGNVDKLADEWYDLDGF